MLSSILLCLVVGITDGDTLKVRCGEAGAYQQVTVRLAEIDAPEKAQPFGHRAKFSLATLCFGAWATINSEKRDHYGRIVARVECRGQDASAYLVQRGMAWAYVQYLHDEAIRQDEAVARRQMVGLWSHPGPVAPWEWRRSRRGQR